MGVPPLGCECRVCRSPPPRDNRTRPSVLLSRAGRNVVIDTTPDFRFHALRVGLQRLDAVVFTHAHADHILGFDDIRPFNMRQKSEVPVYGSAGTLSTLPRPFAYVFYGSPAISTISPGCFHEIDGPFPPLWAEVVPVPSVAGGMDVLGVCFWRGAYFT